MPLHAESFQPEIEAAAQCYDKFVVCIDKTPEDFIRSLQSLMKKAITAFETRAAGMRHGIALDRHVTIILSQTDDDRPLCGIYFNLHSPYRKPVAQKTSRSLPVLFASASTAVLTARPQMSRCQATPALSAARG